MASLHDVIAFLARNYPHKDELSNARVTKMIYLADWRAAIRSGRQITSIEWPFNHYGPFTSEVMETAKSSNDFAVLDTENIYGSPKQIIRLRDAGLDVGLEPQEEEALRHVIETTKDLSWAEFIELVYSTYPVVSQSRYSTLDLVALARQYAALKEALPGQNSRSESVGGSA